jgi:hypothetical protein
MSTAEFLKLIENSSGLLLECENGIYAFAHLTFQEYLAAKHIQEEKLESHFLNYVGTPWWHETIRLYAALGDASNIVEACISTSDPSVPALTLAVECLEEAPAIQPRLRDKVNGLVRDGIEHHDRERRGLAAETILALRLCHLTRVNDDHYIDNSLITNAEYQLFIDESRAKSNFHQPDHWSTFMFSPGSGRDPIAGVRPSDGMAFCAWLSSRESGDWQYHLPNHDLGTCGSGQVGYWVLGDGQPALKGLSTRLNSAEFTPVHERLKHDLTLARDRALDRALASASARDRVLDLALARDLDLDHARALDLDYALASALASARILALARDRALALANDIASASDRARASASARAKARIVLLDLLCWLPVFNVQKSSWRDRLLLKSVSKIGDLKSDFRNAYIALAIIEDRIEGKQHPFEGIRIVKVRRRPESKAPA